MHSIVSKSCSRGGRRGNKLFKAVLLYGARAFFELYEHPSAKNKEVGEKGQYLEAMVSISDAVDILYRFDRSMYTRTMHAFEGHVYLCSVAEP